MVRLYVDAAVKGNPGPAACGILIVGENLRLQKSFPFDTEMDNHTAEFAAVVKGVSLALQEGLTASPLQVFSDSQTVVQIIDENQTRNENFRPYLLQLQELFSAFPLVVIRWIPEKENKGAHTLAQQGLQKILKQKT